MRRRLTLAPVLATAACVLLLVVAWRSPLTCFTLPMSVVLVAWAVRAAAADARLDAGHCVRCGYHLRGCQFRCLRCGAQIPAPRAPLPRDKRCVKCGYDLRGSDGRCPECGTPMRTGNTPPGGSAPPGPPSTA